MCDCCRKDSGEYRELEALCEYLKIISDTNRLRILCLLKHGELCVCHIYEQLDLSQNLVSHHLKVLLDAGLVSKRRDGKWIHYRLEDHKALDLMKLYERIVLKGTAGREGLSHQCL